MTKRYLIPFALILMLLLAACSAPAVPEVNQADGDSMPETAEEGQVKDMDEAMDENMDGDSPQEAMDEAMDVEEMDEVMDNDAHQDGMDKAMDEAMEDDGHQDGVEDGMDDGDEMDEMMEEDQEGDMVEVMLPAWQTIVLINAATGEEFTLGDFQGKTVFVEPMATWCSNCRQQQGQVREARAQLGDDVVFIGLSLETNLPPEQLATYAQGNGFDWTYAVMPVELLAQLTDEFGRSITSAPSTPHFIIRPDGSFTTLATGIHPANAIVAEIQAEQG